jgi:hypothetical protein
VVGEGREGKEGGGLRYTIIGKKVQAFYPLSTFCIQTSQFIWM